MDGTWMLLGTMALVLGLGPAFFDSPEDPDQKQAKVGQPKLQRPRTFYYGIAALVPPPGPGGNKKENRNNKTEKAVRPCALQIKVPLPPAHGWSATSTLRHVAVSPSTTRASCITGRVARMPSPPLPVAAAAPTFAAAGCRCHAHLCRLCSTLPTPAPSTRQATGYRHTWCYRWGRPRPRGLS